MQWLTVLKDIILALPGLIALIREILKVIGSSAATPAVAKENRAQLKAAINNATVDHKPLVQLMCKHLGNRPQ